MLWKRKEEKVQSSVPQVEPSVGERGDGGYRRDPYKYGWGMFFEDVDRIWNSLIRFRGKVNWIIAIERGGLCLGVVLSDRLKVPLYSLRVRGYAGREKLQALQVGWIPDKFQGQSVILVDDIVDGGRTFKELEELLESKGIKVVGRVALCKRSGVEGDYLFGREIEKGAWVNFPWWFPD